MSRSQSTFLGRVGSALWLAVGILADAEVRAQASKLVLTGSVEKLDVRCINGKPVPEIITSMQFRNDGNETLILMDPMAFFTERSIELTGGPGIQGGTATSPNYNPYLKSPFDAPGHDDYDPTPHWLSALRKSLETATEPAGSIKVEPGRYYEFRSVVWTDLGFDLELSKDTSKPECERVVGRPKPKSPTFRVRYTLPFKRHADGLLARLRDRWEKHGTLVMTDDGNVVYRSEEIVFPPPPQQ